MYTYLAYGLHIYSSIELPELTSCQSATADITIKFEKLESNPLKNNSSYYCFKLGNEGLYLFWHEIGTILISNGKEIIIDPIPNFEERRLRLFILGAAIGTLLHQRGYTVLHASAVAINNNAVVFTADKGRGKSTMAAALHARGHDLIADDVVAIDFDAREQPIVYPAFPQLKLWPDAVAHLGQNPDDLPKLSNKFEKREYISKADFVKQPLKLQQIFVLGQDDEIAVKQLFPQQIILYLLRNTYVARFGATLLPRDTSQLSKLSKLVNHVSINRLVRPKSLELLSQVAETVEKYVKVN